MLLKEYSFIPMKKQGCTDACIPAFVLENHFFSINSLKIGSERSTTAVSTQ